MGVPSLVIQGITASTSSDKAKYLTRYFADQQILTPTALNSPLPPIHLLTDQRLNTIQTSKNEVLKILKSLDTGKANGSDGVSNRLLKEASLAIAEPLSNLFNRSFDLAQVPKKWKESNICPIHKKDDRSIVSNYRPIALLSCVGKIQERIVFIHLYHYLKINHLLTWKNSGFKELDSAINQLISITDNIHNALEAGKEVCMVFLDVSKAFDRVWHQGLLHKLTCLGIEGPLLNWIRNYLADRKIRVVINGQTTDWINTNAGVPQGSILGPLLFLVFINDIVNNIESNIHLFADDTSLMDIIDDHIQSYEKINRDLQRLSTWASTWLVTFNAAKTVFLQVSRKINQAPKPILTLDGVIIKEVSTHKHLGLIFNRTLNWSDHIDSLVTKAGRCIGLLRRINRDVPRECLEILYKSMVRPILEYCDTIYDGSTDTTLKRLESTQRQAALTCTNAYKHTHHETLLEELSWAPLSLRRKHHRLNLMYKIQHEISPDYLSNLCPPLTRERTPYDLRTGMNITAPSQRTTTYQKSFFPQTINDWNLLPLNIREIATIHTFKETLKKSAGPKPNKLYHHNNNTAAINLARIRLGLSGLSAQRFEYNHIQDPKCLSCGAATETPIHYLLLCPTYQGPRQTFIQEVCEVLTRNNMEIDFLNLHFRNYLIDTILRGDRINLDLPSNLEISSITQTYIKDSHRF
jgi:hypothetical protein